MYKKVIVIGYGKLAAKVLKFVWKKQKFYNYQVECIEYETGLFSATEPLCRENKIQFNRIIDKQELSSYLGKISQKTLIISAYNSYIFPDNIVSNDEVTIVNFHPSLLPMYGGSNPVIWQIVEGEKESGYTWHYVSEKIDRGDIIVQGKCDIRDDEKTYQLTGRLMDMGDESFQAVFDLILKDRIVPKKQILTGKERIYYSREVPYNAKVSLNETTEFIYRILRGMDYGIIGNMPHLRLMLPANVLVKIIKYKRIENVMGDRFPLIDEEHKRIYLKFEDKTFLEIKYEKAEE